jgi:Nucleotidyltransferase domain
MVEAIVAVGSSARKRARPTSDIDLIIVCKDRKVETSAPSEIDARWVDVEVLRASIGNGNDVFAWAVMFGVALHDPHRTWFDLVADWRGRIPLPSVEVCARRAERARGYAQELSDIGDEAAAEEQVLTMLTHQARYVLSKVGVFPASRPELVDQLRSVGEAELSDLLAEALSGSLSVKDALANLALRPPARLSTLTS